jgi:type IV pilus assembly protein PilY1
MKKKIVVVFLALMALVSSGPLSSAYSAVMTDYCQNPPLIPQPIDPNILFVLDISGSMGWCGYYTGSGYNSTPCSPVDSNGDGLVDGYNPSTGYEGYFTPSKFYTLVSGVYQENPSPGSTCNCSCTSWSCQKNNSGGCDPKGTHGCSTSRWACCTAQTCTGACDNLSGNYLNYAHMARLDLLRWALTGGTPSSCGTTSPSNGPDYCDPELYNKSGNNSSGKVGTVCSDTLAIDGASELGGCILEMNDGTQVKVPWLRVHDSLAFKFVDLELRPRMGAMFYSGSSVYSSSSVYIGDATTAANTIDLNYPYKNLITKVNATAAANSTPTGPAMWDAYNYFAQNNAQFSGLSPMPVGSTTERWRNPMYVCDQTGLSCTFVPCAGNFVILLSDGQWNSPGCTIGSNPSCTSTSSSDPVIPAYCMHKGFQNKSAVPATNSKVSGVYTVGLFMSGTGVTAMKNIAMYGSFENSSKTWPDSKTDFPISSCTMTDCGSGTGSGCTALPATSLDWDKDANSVPDTFFQANNALEIKDSIISVILDILQTATSGTAVSILASGEGSGANLLQAFFYPKKSFIDTDIDWVGEMQNLWYYLDPKLQVSTIREDTDSDKKLELKNDYVVHFRFDSSLNKTRADLSQDVNGDGSVVTYQKTVDLEQTKSLWEAGRKLWSRDLSASPRTLYTTTNGTSLSIFTGLDTSLATVRGYLQAATSAEAADIINYVKGIDLTGYRGRTVSIDLNANSVIDSGETKVWKLGDIVSSTPKTESWVKLNTYDTDSPAGYNDLSYGKFVNSLDYQARGAVYVGSNDGMLHAFKLGVTEMSNNPSDKFQIAEIKSSVDLGKEMWAYIPKNSLPYLKYLTDPNYCHLYYVDATPNLFDASINIPADSNCTCSTLGDYSTCCRETTFIKDISGNDTRNVDFSKTSWRTIIIGGMGQGGACRATTGTCASGNCSSTTATSCTVNANCPSYETCLLNCVKTPVMDPVDNTKGLGYSSYFALDVTDPGSPSLLWEFSDPALGFSTSGPAVVRIGDKTKNGNWYAVFASGSTGPINTGLRQFMGKSDQNLKLFVLNLKTGVLVRTIDTGLSNAFAGSIVSSCVDTDRWRPDRTGNYQDDVFYVSYTQKSGTNWIGGVLRVTTKESAPSQWVVSTLINGTTLGSNIGAVTSAVSHLQDKTNHRLWVYFGTGRYFYKIGTDIDDADTRQRIYGVKDPCYLVAADRYDPSCTASVTSLTDSTTSAPTSEPTSDGWYITLDSSGSSYKAERVITNALAAFTGGVFFTTFAPTSDICGYSGNSYLWAVNYTTGGSAPSSALKGTALIQVSTGEIKEVPLATSFTDKASSGDTQGRRTAAFQGVPPKGQGLSVVINPRPMKKILHMQEK